ncbi:hypothetical protein [Aquirufa ecclesiirivi]|uniref:hypothetical protein n=1 Tax=Aquirufa ecclesiirivi TaxID=2715124 RepID=UPI00140B31FA|nr:hypothetical protein [Aquirufa ecclesiirivi]NHC49870.1 hypothetical protein [Aquirufa ecclesiirivi]
MDVVIVKSGEIKEIVVERLQDSDYKEITKSKYHFNWKKQKENDVYKLRLIESEEILGLMSMKVYTAEKRIEIVLLACSIANTRKNKIFDRIAGNLIAFACREAIKLFGADACVSLIPKTKLKNHYMSKYGMLDAGRQIYLASNSLINLLIKYKV